MHFQRCIGDTYYLERQEEIDALASELQGIPRVALDTEADSLHHYREKVCLIQISFQGRHIVVDPLVGADLSRLLDTLAQRLLVLHGADYDLRLLKRCYGFVASEIFDTMLAAQLLGYKQLSLSSVVERTCGVVLSKHGQKADWSRRPLPANLIEYATNDTRHLLCLADQLARELKLKGRLAWHREACRRLVESAAACGNAAHRHGDWKVKGWHTLQPGRAHAILYELWQWREHEAQTADLPPFKILRNEVLVELARWVNDHGLKEELPQLPRNIRGGRLERLLRALVKGYQSHPSSWPRLVAPSKKTRYTTSQEVLARLRAIRDKRALELGIEPSVLCSNSVLQLLADRQPTSRDDLMNWGELSQWQVEVLADEFLLALQEMSPTGKTSEL
ncbi:MAG: ribonuclease D [Candidatus Sumerlaeaceae bacterium]